MISQIYQNYESTLSKCYCPWKSIVPTCPLNISVNSKLYFPTIKDRAWHTYIVIKDRCYLMTLWRLLVHVHTNYNKCNIIIFFSNELHKFAGNCIMLPRCKLTGNPMLSYKCQKKILKKQKKFLTLSLQIMSLWWCDMRFIVARLLKLLFYSTSGATNGRLACIY